MKLSKRRLELRRNRTLELKLEGWMSAHEIVKRLEEEGYGKLSIQTIYRDTRIKFKELHAQFTLPRILHVGLVFGHFVTQRSVRWADGVLEAG